MSPATRLFELLPSVYRVRDADRDNVLEALLAVLDAEAERLEEDVERLYDNWFVETCDDWLVPYVGDLLGVRTLVPIEEGTFSRRAMVANTLAYRRGKGTAATLEQLAGDITGWPARALEMFELLGTTQFLNHLRPHNRLVDLRDWNALELIDTPFDTSGHTIDVRHVDNRRGKHNVTNVALFLWRLGAYPLVGVRPVQAGPGRYRFGQLGADLPLFTRPLTETDRARLATEANVPGPLRRGALHLDLDGYRERNLPLPPDARAETSDYYGAKRSILVTVGGTDVGPAEVVAADLSAWSRPPAAVTGRASGSLDPFPALASPAPALDVTVGAIGPRTATFAAVPATIDEARDLLEAALRTADPAPELAAALVGVVGDRLVVLPGVTGAAVAFTASASDATTVGDLKLGASSTAVSGILSRRLGEFPELPANAALRVSGAGEGPHEIALSPVPADPSAARAALEAAIRGASGAPAFSAADVALVGDRLLVMPGVDGVVLHVRGGADDSRTAWLLGLSNVVAVDPKLGRLAFALGAEPPGAVTVSYSYGFSAGVGGGPYDPRPSLAELAEPDWERSVSQTEPGDADFASIAAALDAWADPGDGASGNARITIADNGTYSEALDIPPLAADDGFLAIVAAEQRRPTIRLTDGGAAGDVRVQGASEPRGTLVLNGLLIEGDIRLEARSIERLRVEHCTLVPGRSLTGDGRAAHPGAPSLVAAEGNEHLEIDIYRSITGPLAVHEEVAALRIRDSIVDSPAAPHARAALSGNLQPFPTLTTAAPSLEVTIGDGEPHAATLRSVPSSLAEARTLLQEAIRDAHWSEPFRNARVGIVASRLLVIAGTPENVSLTPAGSDPTAAELRFDDAAARAPLVTVSKRLQPFPTVTSAAPAVGVDGRTAQLSAVPATLAQARARLQDAIRAAGGGAAFSQALVAAVGGSLVVLPGDDAAAWRFHSLPEDRTTAGELGLTGSRPAISFTDDGVEPGPRTTLDRVTVFGEVRVRELALASESIFFDPVVAVRRQLGCVRFSYLAPGSLAPRRYRCQPPDWSSGFVRPVFTSTSYGHPAYAQLAAACPSEIFAGAEDEGEIGAFNLLQQNQRIENLRASLGEYVRFGLEAGIFLAT